MLNVQPPSLGLRPLVPKLNDKFLNLGTSLFQNGTICSCRASVARIRWASDRQTNRQLEKQTDEICHLLLESNRPYYRTLVKTRMCLSLYKVLYLTSDVSSHSLQSSPILYMFYGNLLRVVHALTIADNSSFIWCFVT